MTPSASHRPRRLTATPAEKARGYLARRFSGEWDGPLLLCSHNQVDVHFDALMDRSGVALWLQGIHVAHPGTGLGGQVIEALREHADHTGLPLLAGPAVNHGYWISRDGIHPRRHPWLTVVGTKNNELVYAYAPTGDVCADRTSE